MISMKREVRIILALAILLMLIPIAVDAAKCPITKFCFLEGTTLPIEGMRVDLVNAATGDVVETKYSDKNGYVTFLIHPSSSINYILKTQKDGYNEDEPTVSEEFPSDKPHHDAEGFEQTGDICSVSVVPTSKETAIIPDSIVLLYSETIAFGPESVSPSGGIVFKEVPYGTYKIVVTAHGFKQSEEEKDRTYVVDKKCKKNGWCLCEFQPVLTSTLYPTPIPTPSIPAFQIIPAIVALLAVAYLLTRRK